MIAGGGCMVSSETVGMQPENPWMGISRSSEIDDFWDTSANPVPTHDAGVSIPAVSVAANRTFLSHFPAPEPTSDAPIQTPFDPGQG